jgi:Zn-dependent peptidase ImmA (M78 family)
MQLLARRVRQRQDAAAELYGLLEEPPPWQEAAPRFDTTDRADLARVARVLLGVGRQEQADWAEIAGTSQRRYAPLRAWIDAVEGLGILVMQDGSMAVEVLRGFASTHPTVPAVVVNSTDDPRARAFTVLHELGHLVLATTGAAVGPQTEQWCNEFAGEILIPRDWLVGVVRASQAPTLLTRVDEVAHRFSVTPLAAAVRLHRTQSISPEESEEVIAQIHGRAQALGTRGGGNYYRNTIGRLGPAFVQLVFSALDTQVVTYPTASTLLGNVKVNHFATLRDHLRQRTEAQ